MTDKIAEVKRASDQGPNAMKAADFLLACLDLPLQRKERDIVLANLGTLRDLPDFEKLGKEEIRKHIEELTKHIGEIRKKHFAPREFFNKAISELEVLDKRLEKIHFDEKAGFIWKIGEGDNISQLQDLSDNLVKLHGKGMLFSEDETTNKMLLSLYQTLTEHCNNASSKALREYGREFSKTSISHFFSMYQEILGLLGSLNKDCGLLKAEREDLTANEAALAKEGLSMSLNKRIAGIRHRIGLIVQNKEKIILELELIDRSMRQTIQSLEEDTRFLGTMLHGKVQKFFTRSDKMIVNDPYYLEAKSSRTFFNPKATLDPTGVFTREESYSRLFLEKPVFDKERIYPMDADIKGLISAYFTGGDRLIDDFSGFRAELDDLAKRSPKLDQGVKGVLVIPVYNEEKVIAETLHKYSMCKDLDKIAIIIFENKPVNRRRDTTLTKIQLFKLNNPHIRLYHVFKSFTKKMPIGFLRKYLTEYALLLKYYSGIPGNLVIIGGDSDCVSISPNFISLILREFHSNPSLDAVETKMDFPSDYRFTYPNLWIIHRAFDFAFIYNRNKINPNKAIRMYGPASAVKASSYLMIKGYNPRNTICEDLQLGWLLDHARRIGSQYSEKEQMKKSYDERKKEEENEEAWARSLKFFQYIPAIMVTNPRRSISAYLSKFSFLDMYSDFSERSDINGIDWHKLIESERDKGIVNVGNTYSDIEIRNAIASTRLEEGKEIYKTLAYNLQRFIDWWHRKVEPIDYKRTHPGIDELQKTKNQHLSRWMDKFQFDLMLKRIMSWIGIEYQIQYTSPEWTFTILDIERFMSNIHAGIQEYRKRGAYVPIEGVTALNYRRKAPTQIVYKKPRLILVGHRTGDVGEVADAEKMIEICRSNGIECDLYDIFDFFPRNINLNQWNRLGEENYQLAKEDKINLSPEGNPLTEYAFQRIQWLKKVSPNGVVWIVTWPWNELCVARLGFHLLFPVIGMFYPHEPDKEKGLYSPLLRSFNVLSCLTPVAAKSALTNGVPESNIILGQHKYSNSVDKIYYETKSSREDGKKGYLRVVLKRLKKPSLIPENPILIGSISRLISVYNNSKILESLIDLCRKDQNIFLLFKGTRPQSDADALFFDLLDRYKDLPNLIYDPERSPMPEIFRIYSYLDLSIFFAPVGNASAEIAGVGTPLILHENLTNHSLFKGMAEFFRDEGELLQKVKAFIGRSRGEREKMRALTRKNAINRFSPDMFVKKVELALEAAMQYHANSDNNRITSLQARIRKQFSEDQRTFGF